MSEIDKLAKLREPFKKHQIGKLPKPTRKQTDAVKNNFKDGVRCKECGGWHHPQVVHLDYVGHAALTDRLLDVDAKWNWEPVALDEVGLPRLDANGGLWIKLHILGVSRLGYGDAGGKNGADAMKERIGDALRNAAMRFGCALDLWHKGELHYDEDDPAKTKQAQKTSADWEIAFDKENLKTLDEVKAWRTRNGSQIIATLSKPEQVKFKGYLSDYEKDIITPVEEIECKKTGLLSTPEMCRKATCSSDYDKCKNKAHAVIEQWIEWLDKFTDIDQLTAGWVQHLENAMDQFSKEDQQRILDKKGAVQIRILKGEKA